MSLSYPDDVLWSTSQPQVLPFLGYWINPNVVARLKKGRVVGWPREHQIPPSHKNIRYRGILALCLLQHDPPQLLFAFPVQHSCLSSTAVCKGRSLLSLAQLPVQHTLHLLPSREGDTWTPLRCSSSNPLSDTSACGGGAGAIPPRR